MANTLLWLQRFPADLRRRLELAEAAAREARSETHARQAVDLVAVLRPRIPFDEAVERYIEVMSLGGDEAELVRTRALTLLDAEPVDDGAEEQSHGGRRFSWRYATPLGALRYIRRSRRRSAEEDLWMELAAARAEEALVRTHVEHALSFVDLIGAEAAPPRGISYYLMRMDVPSSRSRAVYQRATARVAEMQLPRLPDRRVDTGDGYYQRRLRPAAR